MRSPASKDAYARYDIMNILASYDGPWNLKMQNYSKLNPPMQYNRIQAEGVFDSASGTVWVKDWITASMNPALKSKLIATTNSFKPEEVFFYGSVAMYSELPATPGVFPNASCKLWVSDPLGVRSPVSTFSVDGSGPNSQQYGTASNCDLLCNQFEFISVGGAPGTIGTFVIDGIIISIPIYT